MLCERHCGGSSSSDPGSGKGQVRADPGRHARQGGPRRGPDLLLPRRRRACVRPPRDPVVVPGLRAGVGVHAAAGGGGRSRAPGWLQSRAYKNKCGPGSRQQHLQPAAPDQRAQAGRGHVRVPRHRPPRVAHAGAQGEGGPHGGDGGGPPAPGRAPGRPGGRGHAPLPQRHGQAEPGASRGSPRRSLHTQRQRRPHVRWTEDMSKATHPACESCPHLNRPIFCNTCKVAQRCSRCET